MTRCLLVITFALLPSVASAQYYVVSERTVTPVYAPQLFFANTLAPIPLAPGQWHTLDLTAMFGAPRETLSALIDGEIGITHNIGQDFNCNVWAQIRTPGSGQVEGNYQYHAAASKEGEGPRNQKALPFVVRDGKLEFYWMATIHDGRFVCPSFINLKLAEIRLP